MECPKCKRVSPDSIHCFYCGWQEPLLLHDEGKEKSAEEPDAQKEQMQPDAGLQAQSNNEQPEIKPEGNSLQPNEPAQPKAELKPVELKKEKPASDEPKKKPPEDREQRQPGTEQQEQLRDEQPKVPSPTEPVESVKGYPDQVDDHNKQSSSNREVKGPAVQGQGKGKENKEKLPPSSGKKTKIKDSDLEQFNAVKGNKNIFVAKLNQNFHGREPADRSYEEKTFVECTTELPNKDASVPDFVSEEMEDKSATLKQERLILISCIDHNIAQAAAYALIEKLSVSDNGRRRLLNFERLEEDCSGLSIYRFLKKKAGANEQTVIVADAITDRAQQFLDSLLDATVVSYREIKRDLKDNSLFLICLVDLEKTDKRLSNVKSDFQFVHWKLPFLRQLLRPLFPDRYLDLEERILRQRTQGRWNKDESEFCRQVKSYLKSNQLIEQIESRDTPAKPFSENPDFDDDKPVHNTVLYVATFFPNLSPNEFNRVVSMLLGDQTMTITITVDQKGEDGVTRPVEIQKEKSLIQEWRVGSDRILKECRLVTSKDSNKAITFSDIGRKDELMGYLEEEYGLYIQNKFVFILDNGLLFDSSERIARNVIRLIIEMAAAYPDYYGKDWLSDVVSKLRKHFELGENSSPNPSEPMLHLLGKPGGLRTKPQTYKRISELIREMLDYSQLKQVVTGFVEQLIGIGYHDSALEIIRNLRFAPEFDKFHWAKQLIDRGDEDIRFQTYLYLYGEVKGRGPQVYQILHTLEPWLPAVDRDPQKYSPSNRFALRLMIEYCLEITSNFDSKNYGSWPTRYPLLAVKDIDTAQSNFELLTKWLFHPGMKYVVDGKGFDEDLNRLLPALISEWAFILLGQPEHTDAFYRPLGGYDEYSPETEGRDATSGQPQNGLETGITADAALNILLAKIIEITSAPHQKEIQQGMLKYWEEMIEFLAFATNAFAGSLDNSQRVEFIWKRNLIRELLKRFGSLRRELKASQQEKVSG